ncbi:DUF4913 domain-containing protein [Streptomyces paradoxus]|uniref:DUF4913 domain-containing protein n=1 Tax=Streptomyces paradoxus TaxID=66375 RepID=UPI0036FF93E0
MAEDLEDLKAKHRALSAQLKALTESAGREPGEAFGEDDRTTERPTRKRPRRRGRRGGLVVSAVHLVAGLTEYETELRAWPNGSKRCSSPGTWRSRARTPAAICGSSTPSRSPGHTALWLAWQGCTDPASCGYTGPSVWHRDHLDPCMRELRGPGGPFASRTKNEHTIVHRLPVQVPTA